MSINLQKITLKKQGDSHSIDLSKKGDSILKEITINLNWSQGNKKSFFSNLFNNNAEVDLDLGCFYELNDGQKNVIDGLQFSKRRGGSKDKLTLQGRYTDTPWVWHTGDDRGQSAGSGENILINPKGIHDLKRIVIYCFIYDGVAKWEETNAIVNIEVPGSPAIEVEMGRQSSQHKFCAIAEILFTSTSIKVKKLTTFHNSHGDCDKSYNWGMKWTSGAK
ncbi:stress protein [Pedobacter sp. UYP1]|uniref:stress protein n=1 Tax=Pedobacter sp. UYP1 TaxID=1756396 RepID=UPI0033917FEF